MPGERAMVFRVHQIEADLENQIKLLQLAQVSKNLFCAVVKELTEVKFPQYRCTANNVVPSSPKP